MKVSEKDYLRLSNLVQSSTNSKSAVPAVIVSLKERLSEAEQVTSEDNANIIAMHSKVVVREVRSGRENEITIVYPDEADPKSRKISVLSPVGAALLGRKQGERVTWDIPSGTGVFDIVRIKNVAHQEKDLKTQ